MNGYNDKQLLYCKFCSKECHSRNSLLNHQKRCKDNPERLTSEIFAPGHVGFQKGKSAWNKGLTKETDKRLAALSQKIKIIKKNNPQVNCGRASTPEKEAERRAKISDYAKSRNFGGLTPRSGRGKKGWYKGYFCDSTYELVYVIYNIDHNVSFQRCERCYPYTIDGEQHNYYPDFELSDGSLVEIKGYHTDIVDIKTESVTDRPIVVLFEKDLKYAFDWVKKNYSYNCLYDLYDK